MAETGQAEIARAVPAARWKAKEEGIDLSLVRGSGPHGVILPRDLEQARVTQGAIEATLKERRIHASTLARKLAEREGVALESVEGSGTSGSVMMAEVERATYRGTLV
jgi:pyruvate dehydrogenase E2 component (dihydrolipoamide acetyltransferase)